MLLHAFSQRNKRSKIKNGQIDRSGNSSVNRARQQYDIVERVEACRKKARSTLKMLKNKSAVALPI